MHSSALRPSIVNLQGRAVQSGSWIILYLLERNALKQNKHDCVSATRSLGAELVHCRTSQEYWTAHELNLESGPAVVLFMWSIEWEPWTQTAWWSDLDTVPFIKAQQGFTFNLAQNYRFSVLTKRLITYMKFRNSWLPKLLQQTGPLVCSQYVKHKWTGLEKN